MIRSHFRAERLIPVELPANSDNRDDYLDFGTRLQDLF